MLSDASERNLGKMDMVKVNKTHFFRPPAQAGAVP